MAIKVIWFADRLGHAGNLASHWLRELNQNGVKPTQVKVVSLHKELHGQLLVKFGNRQAPTWKPERTADIVHKMQAEIRNAGPDLRAVVLASPESLAIIGLGADVATLGKLRGGVYEIMGIPALVCLPMSAWLSKVSTREIQNANFGASSRQQLESMYEAKDIGDLTEDFDGGVSDDCTDGIADESSLAVGSGDRGASSDGRGRRKAESGVVALRGDSSGHSAAVSARRWDVDSSDARDLSGLNDDSDGGELEEDDEDKFFYVPVVVPVGKMMIQFDLAKLGRIVTGKAGSLWLPK